MKRVIVAAAVVLAGALLLYWLRSARGPELAAYEGAPAKSIEPTAAPAAPHAAAAAAKSVVTNPAGPRAAPAAPDGGGASARSDAGAQKGDAALFGKMVSLGNSFALGEALAKNAQAADQLVDKLCERAKKLRAKPAVPDLPARERDAAQFMAPLMDYEAPLDQPPGKLHFSQEFRDRLTRHASQFDPLRYSDSDLAGLDFSWMPALAAFDHWTVLTAGRLRDFKMDNGFAYPIPNYASLMVWCKLRYALAARRGDWLQASAEVRHLADLIRSQELLISLAVSVALYKVDARAREAAAASGVDVTGWPALDGDAADETRRLAFASMYFAWPGVSAETLRKAADCFPSPCTALIEGAVAHRSFGAAAATDNLPFLKEQFAARGCEGALLDKTLEARELPTDEALDSAASEVDGRLAGLLGP